MDNIEFSDLVFEGANKIKLRNENNSTPSELYSQFIPLIEYSSLRTPNTQIVYGRNGTGKTHFLRAFHYDTLKNFEKELIFPIIIYAQDLEMNYSSEFTANELVKKYYNKFVANIISSLKTFFEANHTISRFEKIFGGQTKIRLDSIKESITKIEEYLNEQKIEEKLTEYVKRIEIRDKDYNKIWAKSEASVKLSPEKISADISGGAGISGEMEHINTTAVDLVFKGLSFIDFEEIRNELENIISKCEAKSIIILVDEWSSVNLSLQPMLAEMIKKTLTSSPKIFVKIFALKYFTNLSAVLTPPHRIGFQAGIDITPLADLDDLLTFENNLDNVSIFLTAILHSHLKEYVGDKMELADFGEQLANHFFDSENTYNELLRASEGNPRDFLDLFSLCAQRINMSSDDKIHIKTIVREASRFFIEHKATEIKNNKIANVLFSEIFKKAVLIKEKTFLVPTQLVNEYIKELWHYRFIHLLNPCFSYITEAGEVEEYVLFSIDYGKLLSLRISERGEKVVGIISDSYKKLLKTGLIPSSVNMTIEFLTNSKIIKEEQIKKWSGLMLTSDDFTISSNFECTDDFVLNCSIEDIILNAKNHTI